MPDPLIHLLFDVYVEGVQLGGTTYTAADNLHIWDGDKMLTITKPGATTPLTYTGVGFSLEVSPIETKTGIPDQRFRVSLGIADENTAARTILSQDFGPLRSEVRFIVSRDGGATWAFLPVWRKGRISNSEFANGLLSVELETPRGDIKRGRPRYWSDENQQARYPDDKGFEFLEEMQRGYSSTFPFGFIPDVPLRTEE